MTMIDMPLVTFQGVTDQEVLHIMHEHNTYRNLKRRYDELYPRGASQTGRTKEELDIIAYFDRPLMSDEEFLVRLGEITGDGPPICSTEQVVSIHNLRVQYEFVPPDSAGRYPNYKAISIRIRVAGAMRRINEGRSTPERELLPIAMEQQRHIFGSNMHAHRFLLREVLAQHIGRWKMNARLRDGSKFLFGSDLVGLDIPVNEQSKVLAG